jgi:hypothetical protein
MMLPSVRRVSVLTIDPAEIGANECSGPWAPDGVVNRSAGTVVAELRSTKTALPSGATTAGYRTDPSRANPPSPYVTFGSAAVSDRATTTGMRSQSSP